MPQLAYDTHETWSSSFLSHTDYMEFCLELAQNKFSGYGSVSAVEDHLPDINAYPNLNTLKPAENLAICDTSTMNKSDRFRTLKCMTDGRLFTEHLVAGEGTRLKLSTKYLINVAKDLPVSKIVGMIRDEIQKPFSLNDLQAGMDCDPSQLLPISLGVRHMLQFSFDIFRLSKFMKSDPKTILSRQKMLIVLNESSAERIVNEFIAYHFFGFAPCNVLFMVQKSYHGINLDETGCFHDLNSPEHLHNHGHIAISQTMTDEIFYLDRYGRQIFLSTNEFGRLLKEMEMKISYNIEDLDFLTGSIDFEGLCFAIRNGRQGCRMLMEVLPNNPFAPQKGGMAAFDPVLGKNVMIESLQLNGIDNRDIQFLNKNVNFFPRPYDAWDMVKNNGLPLHADVKDGFIYFQPVAGDINFLVDTVIFRRKSPKSIHAWKSPVTTPLAINFMHAQDMQDGFRSYAQNYLGSIE